MNEVLDVLPVVLIATAGGYLLGSIPLAYLISRRHSGVDIFDIGTGLPGASNVLRNVGVVPAVMVFIGDLSKGALAVLLTREILGVGSPWILLPVAAAVAGHWKSMFTGLRGGDGLVTLGGAIIALFPVYGLISVAVASVVALGGQKMPYSSLVNVVVGYGVLAGLAFSDPFGYDTPLPLAFGIGGLCGLVLAHAALGHRRRRHTENWGEADDPSSTAEQS